MLHEVNVVLAEAKGVRSGTESRPLDPSAPVWRWPLRKYFLISHTGESVLSYWLVVWWRQWEVSQWLW